jgi:hypothetical protein
LGAKRDGRRVQRRARQRAERGRSSQGRGRRRRSLTPVPSTRPNTPSRSSEPTFDIDPASLERRYKLLQWTLHPDKSVTRTPEERDFSAAHAAQINQAYGVLRRPLSRANYLVGFWGGPLGRGWVGSSQPGAC